MGREGAMPYLLERLDYTAPSSEDIETSAVVANVRRHARIKMVS